MNVHDALLAAVIADPDEDTPRLVMADWFDENGQPDRAEFIRVQCEIANLSDPIPPNTIIRVLTSDEANRRNALRRRERELKDPSDLTWHLRWPSELSRKGWHYPVQVFRRGFVESVTCSAEDWLRVGNAVRIAQPVTRVELTTRPKMDWWVGNSSAALAGDAEFECTRWRGVRFKLPPRPGRVLTVTREMLVNDTAGFAT